MANILVVDDEHGIRDLLSEILNDEGHNIELAENAAQARKCRLNARPDLVLLDIWMPDTDGVTLLKEWAGAGLLSMPVIMMSGHATIDTAVDATRIGAHSFLEKPITLQKLLKSVSSALAASVLRRPVAAPAPAVPHEWTIAKPLPSDTPAAKHAGDEGRDNAHTQNLASDDQAQAMRQVFGLDKPLRDARDEFERAYFEFHLAQENGSMTRVAEKTGLERTHLYRKLKQLGIDLTRGKKAAT